MPTPVPEIVLVPLLLIGLGIGALASQLGAVTVSAVPDDQSPEVGGIQNTMTNLGASIGTALAGSIMIARRRRRRSSPASSRAPAIPAGSRQQAQVELAGGVPFVSDADLEAALDDAGREPDATTSAALEAYGEARIDGLRVRARDPRAARSRRAVPRAAHPDDPVGRSPGRPVETV